MRLNENFFSLRRSYLFSEVARRTAAFRAAHPERSVIRLSVGDVTRPLAPAAIRAMHRAVEELSRAETFHGYAPEGGYPLLRARIARRYREMGISFGEDEIFVSDGSKSDCGGLSELFSAENTVLIPDPVYPAYLDVNLLAGRKVRFAPASEENGFLPMPEGEADLIYLCSPNNPTGAAYPREALKTWVDYANARGAVILFDAAYEHFVQEEGIARSIYEVDGAQTCAIEICSFSKTAGFTGVRCGYAIVPHALKRGGVSLNALWARRQSAKFNGVSYVSQMGAAAIFTEEGQAQIGQTLAYYRANAKTVERCLKGLGIFYTGGRNSPYIWMRCPRGMDSWAFFAYLLEGCGVVGTPGSGFGAHGEGFFRLTAFGTEEETREACRRMEVLLKE